MYEGNHAIDTPDNEWTPDEVERLFIFCQFDRAMPYEKVCDAYEYLNSNGRLSFGALQQLSLEETINLLRNAKMRFPVQTAKFLFHNVRTFDSEKLKKMSRDEIAVQCHGFGYKLASMFCNRVHGTQYATIDVHIDRFLRINGCTAVTYKDKEKFFIDLANKMGVTPDELDWVVWDANRIGKKKEENHVARHRNNAH